MQTVANAREQTSLNIKLSTATVTRWLIYVVAFIHILNAFAVWIRYEAGPFKFKSLFVNIFQVSSEGKFPTWYSACTLLICSLLLLVISYAKRRTHDRYFLHWLGLAVIFALMSLDEATELHEMTSSGIRSLLDISEYSAWGWEIAGLIFLMVLGLFYFRFLLALDIESDVSISDRGLYLCLRCDRHGNGRWRIPGQSWCGLDLWNHCERRRNF